MNEDYGDIWVCTDCYFAHHYGAHQELHLVEITDDLGGPIERFVELWYAGEDDEPVGGWHEIKHNGTLDHNREPLGLLYHNEDRLVISDNTCGDHDNREHECPVCDDGYIVEPEIDQDPVTFEWRITRHGVECWVCDGTGKIEEPCPHCGGTDDETGLQEYSWSRCEGCGSPLGGHRYRLHLWMREDVKA